MLKGKGNQNSLRSKSTRLQRTTKSSLRKKVRFSLELEPETAKRQLSLLRLGQGLQPAGTIQEGALSIENNREIEALFWRDDRGLQVYINLRTIAAHDGQTVSNLALEVRDWVSKQPSVNSQRLTKEPVSVIIDTGNNNSNQRELENSLRDQLKEFDVNIIENDGSPQLPPLLADRSVVPPEPPPEPPPLLVDRPIVPLEPPPEPPPLLVNRPIVPLEPPLPSAPIERPDIAPIEPLSQNQEDAVGRPPPEPPPPLPPLPFDRPAVAPTVPAELPLPGLPIVSVADFKSGHIKTFHASISRAEGH